MRAKSALVVAGVWLLLAALPVWAHHAFSSEFDISKPLKMQGTLTKWEMINPHSWFHIDVKGRAAHAGVAPQDGRNAASELIHQIRAADIFPKSGEGLTAN